MSLRDRLAAKKLATTTYKLRVENDLAAQQNLREAERAEDQDAINEAKAAISACYEKITITALPPVDMEALIDAHPPPEEQQRSGKSLFNRTTFVPALLAACIDSDVTEAEWAEYTTKGAMTTGEVNDLFGAVWGINYRSPDAWYPKE